MHDSKGYDINVSIIKRWCKHQGCRKIKKGGVKKYLRFAMSMFFDQT